MQLTGPQMGRLQSAMLGAFTLDDLRRLALFELNVNLDAEIGPGALGVVTTNLLLYFNQRGDVQPLLVAVQAARPNNAPLQTVLRELLAGNPESGREVKREPAEPTVSRAKFIAQLIGLGDIPLGLIRATLRECWPFVEAGGPVGSRVIQLVGWAEGATGPGLQKVYDVAGSQFPKQFPPGRIAEE